MVLTSFPLGDILLQFGAMWELWGASSSFVSSSSWLWSLHINGTRTGMCFLWKALIHWVETAYHRQRLCSRLHSVWAFPFSPLWYCFLSCFALCAWLCGPCVTCWPCVSCMTGWPCGICVAGQLCEPCVTGWLCGSCVTDWLYGSSMSGWLCGPCVTDLTVGQVCLYLGHALSRFHSYKVKKQNKHKWHNALEQEIFCEESGMK